MSRPILRLVVTRKEDRAKFEVLTVWPSDRHPGLFSIRLGRASERNQAMGFGDAIRAWASGAYLDAWLDVDQRRAEANSGGNYDRSDDGAGGWQ